MSKYYEYFSVSKTGSSPSGKTDVYSVVSHRGADLGQIKWHGPWRGYAFFPGEKTIFSHGCLEEIKDAIEIITEMRLTGNAWD